MVVVGLDPPGIDGVEFIRRLRAEHPAVKAVVVTSSKDAELVFAALEAGASACVTRTATLEEMRTAIEQAGRGGGWLSGEVALRVIAHFNARGRQRDGEGRLAPREREVLGLLSRGLTCKEIAECLGLSAHTINDHLKGIYAKLHVHSRAAAVARFLDR